MGTSILLHPFFWIIRGKMNGIDTQTLLRRVREDDSFAYELLAERYSAVTERAARSAARYLETVSPTVELSLEDLRQEAQLALYRAARSYDSEKVDASVTFGLYAKICVRNAMTSQIRRATSKRRRRERIALESAFLVDGAATAASSDAELSDVLAEGVLSECGELMSAYERQVFMLYLQGKSNSEISRLTGREAKSVSNALYRIRVKLKGLSN